MKMSKSLAFPLYHTIYTKVIDKAVPAWQVNYFKTYKKYIWRRRISTIGNCCKICNNCHL